MGILVAVFFAIQVSVASGRLTVLRGKEQAGFWQRSRKLLCASEDDGGGLIWNSNLNWLYSGYEFTDRRGNTDFQPLNTNLEGKIHCNVTTLYDECMLGWSSLNWSVTNSKRVPMGPVFDQRWEGFREYNNFYKRNEYHFIEQLWKSGAFVISIRGSTDAHIFLCESEKYETDFCYWIIIGGWINTESTIRKCANGVPNPMAPPADKSCLEKRASYYHQPLSSTEWRTFVVTWDENMRNISVYDTDKLLLTYVNNEKGSSNSNVIYNIFLASTTNMLFRFHIYNFLHTTYPHAALESPGMHLSKVNLCIEMIIGLCRDCQMKIILVDPVAGEEKYIETIKGSTITAAHGLPMWQYVRINETVPPGFRRLVKVKLIPEIVRENPNPLWAISNFRECPPTGSVRYASMEATQDYGNNSFWPNVTCQKLFYNENIVVSSTSAATTNLEFDDLYCPEGKVGPYCSISCSNDLLNSPDCRETLICEPAGCTCPPGFIGEKCQSTCEIGQYGHDCKQTCGSCRADSCNFKTGVCTSGCDNSKRYNLPPFCKIGIDELPPPDIDFVNETVVRVILPVKEEYKLIPSSYSFILQKEGMTSNQTMGDYVKIFRNTTTLIGYTDDLIPGTAYNVSCVLQLIDNSQTIFGKWNNFATRCTPSTQFDVEIRNTSLILKKSRQADTWNSCPNKWYDLTFENRETRVLTKGTLTKLPYEFVELTPYTVYKITISKGVAVLFTREVRTLDGAPSQVRNYELLLTSKGEVKLKWEPPRYKNGIINKYKVVLEIQEYFGCTSLKMTSPKNVVSLFTPLTNVTLLDLKSYARYVAKVSAYTSHPGLEISKTFSTDQTEIPTEVFSNVRVENYTLMWDPPEDCSTISGPIFAEIVVKGVSKSVTGFNATRRTVHYNFTFSKLLHGAETYEARVYVKRGYNREPNDKLYQKIVFTTPPKAPPPVRNLEIFEIDSVNKNIQLRWQEPQAPINGKIQHYIVSTCDYHCRILLVVSPVEYCTLWNEYICAIVTGYDRFRKFDIKVSAMNVNVSTPGTQLSVPINKIDTKPEAPETFTVEAFEKGVVNLSWPHPWRTGGHLEKFSIIAELISSNLRKHQSQSSRVYEHPVREYRIQYNEQLHLLSASTYKISVCGVTNADVYGKEKIATVQTPLAMAFEKELITNVSDADLTISLHIPVVLNDTKQSLTRVVVKDSQPCNHSVDLNPILRKKAGIESDERAWLAATFPTNTFAGKTFIVGNRKLYDGITNCPLKPGESYVIVVIVQTEEGSIGDRIVVAKTTSIRIGAISTRHEAWIIPVAILVIAVAVAFYFYRRKKKGPLKEIVFCEEMPLAHNTENTEEKPSLLNSKPILAPTRDLSEKDTLSRTSTPYGSNAVLVNDVKRREEGASLVKVNDFEDYVKRATDSGLLDAQYSTFPRGQTKPWEYGKLPQNKPKNRYGNLIAYDENRVILKKLPDDPHSDYINANYIKGYKKEKCYIATQGPKANTVIDFWRMIWQEKVLVICMVANTVEGGKVKCEQYWPDIGKKKKKYGDVVVFTAKHTVFADYTFRVLHVTNEAETRKIEHLHYTAWPDHGVPLSTHSVVSYLKKLLATSPGNGPVVVHCSAGVGRTGTIILCDICLRRAAAEGMIDVFTETEAIRSQRANTVDTKQQYLLAHLVLVECLLSIPTSVPCSEVLELKIKELKNQLPIQKQSLEKASWKDEALRPPTSQMSLSECNLAKNRFPELVSAKVNRVYLKRYPPTDEDSDYISAVYVDGVRLQNQYLATQLPLPATFCDFWRMVAEYKVELIILLQPPDPQDPTCCPIVPRTEFKPVPHINVKTKELIEFEYYTSQKLILVNNMEKPVTEQQIIILCSTEWKAGRNEDPPETMTLVTLWQAAERISRGDGPTVVLCHDGVTGCGLYLALSFLLERMAVERECDVCLAIRAIRRSRPDFVQSLKHMEYLYDAAITYLKYFETYANFT